MRRQDQLGLSVRSGHLSRSGLSVLWDPHQRHQSGHPVRLDLLDQSVQVNPCHQARLVLLDLLVQAPLTRCRSGRSDQVVL